MAQTEEQFEIKEKKKKKKKKKAGGEFRKRCWALNDAHHDEEDEWDEPIERERRACKIGTSSVVHEDEEPRATTAANVFESWHEIWRNVETMAGSAADSA